MYGGPGQEQLRPSAQVKAKGVAPRLEDMELRSDFGLAQFDEEGDAVGQRRHHRVVGGQANEGRRSVGADMPFQRPSGDRLGRGHRAQQHLARARMRAFAHGDNWVHVRGEQRLGITAVGSAERGVGRQGMACRQRGRHVPTRRKADDRQFGRVHIIFAAADQAMAR